MSIEVFTDGACLMNGSDNAVGGMGVHFPDGELKDVSKVYRYGKCTNQKTELYAIYLALKYIDLVFDLSTLSVLIKTDSQYSINVLTKWIGNWLKNGWKTAKGTPVENKKLIEQIYEYVDNYDITFEHVMAHTGGKDYDSVNNDIADKLASKAAARSAKENKIDLNNSKKYYGKDKKIKITIVDE